MLFGLFGENKTDKVKAPNTSRGPDSRSYGPGSQAWEDLKSRTNVLRERKTQDDIKFEQELLDKNRFTRRNRRRR